MSIPLESFYNYLRARKALLADLGVPDSNRDPLSELSEIIAAAKLNATKVKNRVNKGYDLIGPDGERIEVKYVTNLIDKEEKLNWKNWHNVKFDRDERDKYALVVYLNLSPIVMFVFSKDTIGDVCRKLGKRHKNQDCILSFTLTDFRILRQKPDDFKELGVKVFDNLIISQK